jgi:hypothetical protein
MNYEYKAIRPKLWEIMDKNGKALGRIRHVLKPNKSKIGWQASDGKFYEKAKQAALGLLAFRKAQFQGA